MASGDNRQMKCPPKNPSEVLRKLVPLLEHPITQDEVGRQIDYLNDFLIATEYAFWMHDIPFIIRLFEAVSRRFASHPEFQRPLERLLAFTSVPPMLCKSSDKLLYARDLQQYFSMLGYLIICVQDGKLREMVLNSILHLLDPDQIFGICCVPLEDLERAVEQSGLPGTIGEILQFIDEQMLPKLIKVAFSVARISKESSKRMALANGIDHIIRRLESTSTTRDEKTMPIRKPSARDNIRHFGDICRVLWKLLSLQYALRWVVIHPGSRDDRNDLTGIIIKLLALFPDISVVESGLAEDLSILAMTAGGCHCRSNITFFNDEIDFRWKKLLWACMHYLTQPGTEQIIKKNRLVMVFTKFLIKEHTDDEQHLELVRIALKIIPKYFKEAVKDFLYVEGPNKLTKMIETFLRKPYESSILGALFYCLDEILRQNVPEVNAAFNELNIFSIMILVTNQLIELKSLNRKHQACIARAFCILHYLGIYDIAKIDENSINTCCAYLDRCIKPKDGDTSIDIKVAICALDFLWDCVVLVDFLITTLIEKFSGIYLLLDVIKMHSFPVKLMALGVLVDLCRITHGSVPYLITWRKHCHGLIPLLMEIFRGKTEIECYQPEPHDFTRQDKALNQWFALCVGLKTTTMDISKEQLLLASRYRIVGLLRALKVDYKEKVDQANDHYKLLRFDNMTVDDQITMMFADNFLSLKMCQQWIELIHELKEEEIHPTKEDFDFLINIVLEIEQWKLYLRGRLNALAKYEMRSERYEECHTYITLNEARLSAALDALTELKYISKCTETMFQLQRKIRMTVVEVDKMAEISSNYHKTVMDIPFVDVFNQETNIESDRMEEDSEQSEEPLWDFKSISSKNEEVSLDYDKESIFEPISDHCEC